MLGAAMAVTTDMARMARMDLNCIFFAKGGTDLKQIRFLQWNQWMMMSIERGRNPTTKRRASSNLYTQQQALVLSKTSPPLVTAKMSRHTTLIS